LVLPSANIAALDRIMAWLQASIRAYQTIGVETVLSTGKYRPLVIEAKNFGFEISLLYVTLRTVEMNVERVQLRVAQGGHAVDEERIRARRERSFRQLPWFLDQADRALIFDNSGSTPRIIAQKAGGTIQIDRDAPKEIVAAVEALSE
jgi:predicted ABC-type ATPase